MVSLAKDAPGAFFSSLIALIQRLFSGLADTIQNPQGDPKQTLLVIGILVVFLGIVIMVAILMVTSIGNRRTSKLVRRVQRAGHKLTVREAVVGWVIFGAFFVASYAGGYLYITNPSFCVNCHAEQIKAKALDQTTHKDVSCTACHQDPGPGGFLTFQFNYVSWVTTYMADNNKQPVGGTVSNSACLNCHGEVLSKTVSRYDVRVRHKDFLDEGARCVDCHNAVAHGSTVKAKQEPSMSGCISCHDGKKAPSDCKLCHTSDSGAAARQVSHDQFKVAPPLRPDCRGCHDQKICIQCHGLEMPHPANWVNNGPAQHARLGFTNRVMCGKCHDIGPNPGTNFCKKCHQKEGSIHGTTATWIKDHGHAARKDQNYKYLNPGGVYLNCPQCHGPDFCQDCHNDGRKETPNPNGEFGDPYGLANHAESQRIMDEIKAQETREAQQAR